MDEETVITNPEELYPNEAFKEMVEAGIFYGRKKSKTNPKMKPFILTNRNGIEIVDLEKTTESLERAMAFIEERVAKGGLVLFAATQPAAMAIRPLADEFGFPVVTSRWLGGTLTNFSIISRRINHFMKLKSDWAANAFEKYTKKERVVIEKDIARLTETMSGLETLVSRPDILIVIDSNMHLTAVREARVLHIPIVGFVNTDSDPSLIDYPIVGNNKAKMSIEWFLGKTREAIKKGKAKQGAFAAAAAAAAEEAAKVRARAEVKPEVRDEAKK